MRTNIELDDALIAEAMNIAGLPTKKAMVQRALEEFVRIHRQHHALDSLHGMAGKAILTKCETTGPRTSIGALSNPNDRRGYVRVDFAHS